MCIFSYMVNFSLLYYSWFVNRRFGDLGVLKGLLQDIKYLLTLKRIVFPIVAGLLLMSAALLSRMPEYWKIIPSPLNELVATGITEDGHPWIGAKEPALTINEFSDYMCFQCKKMHFMLRRLVEANPDKIRLVHWQFPMDRLYNPLVTERYHSGSGKISIIALYAFKKGKFWQVNDLLFAIGSQKKDFNTMTIAKFMGTPVGELSAALNNKALRVMLKHDIAVGIQKKIHGTPGFVIDDQVYIGTIPKEILQKVQLD